MDIPLWLRTARKSAGLTQENAGALVDVTKGNWSAWEKGRHSPSITQLAKISALLRYPLPEGLGTPPADTNVLTAQELARSVTNLTNNSQQTSTESGGAQYAGPLAYSRRVPVLGSARLQADGAYEEIHAMGGSDGFVLLQTHDSLAYALRVRGDQMAPAIRDGWFVVVSPGAAPAVGEYVAVKLRDGTRMVRELLYKRSDSIAVMEVNGQARQTILSEDIELIHAVSAIIGPSHWQPE